MGHGAPGDTGAPDQEALEPHGAGRGSRSKDDGPLKLGALNQESMGLLRMSEPLELDGTPYQEPVGPKIKRDSHIKRQQGPFGPLGLLELIGAPGEKCLRLMYLRPS